MEGVFLMTEPAEILSLLGKTYSFQSWQKEFSQSFLCHFFCPLENDFQAKTDWDIGYFNPQNEKITVFSHRGNSNFIIQPEEEVFKKENTTIKTLEMDKVKFSFGQVAVRLKEKMSLLFPKQQLKDGFVILQTVAGKTLWNITFLSEALQFLNLKIAAEDGTISSYQAVDLLNREETLFPS